MECRTFSNGDAFLVENRRRRQCRKGIPYFQCGNLKVAVYSLCSRDGRIVDHMYVFVLVVAKRNSLVALFPAAIFQKT